MGKGMVEYACVCVCQCACMCVCMLCVYVCVGRCVWCMRVRVCGEGACNSLTSAVQHDALSIVEQADAVSTSMR